MKKVVGKSLALAVLGLGALSLLGGPNVFSVLRHIKFPSKTKKEKTIVKEVEKPETEVKKESKPEVAGTELSLEASAKKSLEEEPKAETLVVKEKEVAKSEALVPRIESKPETVPIKQNSELRDESLKKEFPKPVVLKPTRTILSDGTIEVTESSGLKVRYKDGVPVWNSTSGRLVDTEEEKAWWRDRASQKERGSSGSEGKGVWCLTPRGYYNVESEVQCSSVPGWGWY